MSEAELPSVERLRWQCRRGMLELDVALSAYLERRYAVLDEIGKRAFIRLLTIDDPTLSAWLLGSEVVPDQELAETIAAIRVAVAHG